MLLYNNEPKRLVATFKRYRNDIDIFTEDEKKDKEFYKILFQRLLVNTNITINDITPLGCRNNVIESCKLEPDNGRRKIFIIDGDIYIIYKQDTENLDNLFILDSYCIENYLVDETSCSQFAYNLIGTMSIEEVKSKINFNDWINIFVSPLIDLFINFSILHEIKGKFTIYNAYKFLNNGKIDFKLVEDEISNVKTEIIGIISEEKYFELLKQRETNWQKTPSNFLKIVSGKDYILPLVQIKCQELRKTKGLFTNESIKILLAQFCNLERLNSLRNVIINLN